MLLRSKLNTSFLPDLRISTFRQIWPSLQFHGPRIGITEHSVVRSDALDRRRSADSGRTRVAYKVRAFLSSTSILHIITQLAECCLVHAYLTVHVHMQLLEQRYLS